jgi:hypothetical protein
LTVEGSVLFGGVAAKRVSRSCFPSRKALSARFATRATKKETPTAHSRCNAVAKPPPPCGGFLFLMWIKWRYGAAFRVVHLHIF